MEYNFKLSEIIAGCESCAWLEGASFENQRGVVIVFVNGFFSNTHGIKLSDRWKFKNY